MEHSFHYITPTALYLRPFPPKVSTSQSYAPPLLSGALLPPPKTHCFKNNLIPIQSCSIPPHKLIYPDPIPEFAIAETRKLRVQLLKKLSKETETFGVDLLHNVINVCAEIFSEFLHEEYGGPGTLLVDPFTDMLIALKEKNLPTASSAARSALFMGSKVRRS